MLLLVQEFRLQSYEFRVKREREKRYQAFKANTTSESCTLFAKYSCHVNEKYSWYWYKYYKWMYIKYSLSVGENIYWLQFFNIKSLNKFYFFIFFIHSIFLSVKIQIYKPFYDELTRFMSSGPIYAFILERVCCNQMLANMLRSNKSIYSKWKSTTINSSTICNRSNSKCMSW